MNKKSMVFSVGFLSVASAIFLLLRNFKLTTQQAYTYNPKRWPKPDLVRESRKLVIKRRVG